MAGKNRAPTISISKAWRRFRRKKDRARIYWTFVLAFPLNSGNMKMYEALTRLFFDILQWETGDGAGRQG
jgi:hypothetical protein